MKREKSSKSTQAYEVMKMRILDGTYAPKERIIIDQIAKEIGSSHIPVREAIRRLEADQLIEYRANVGAVVQSLNDDAYKETLEFLSVLEGYATAMSASSLTKEDLSQLHDLNSQMKEALHTFDLQLFGQLNKAFHYVIYDACSNELLVKSIKDAWDKLDTVRTRGFHSFPLRANDSVLEHDQLLEMLEQKQPIDRIEKFARQHKQNTLRASKQT